MKNWNDALAVLGYLLFCLVLLLSTRMCRRLMRKDPDLTVSEARLAWPFTPAFMSRLGDGLEIGGLPRG